MIGKSCHEFFKVYLSHLSSKQLELPPAFVSKLGGKIPKNCTIKDSDGKIWKVKLEGSAASLVVANGWEEFASHNSLDDGDFLVFDYDGNSQFGVKIYGINGLRKRKSPDAVASTSAVKKGRQQETSNSMSMRSRPQGLRPNRVYKMRNSEMPLKKPSTSPGYEHASGKHNPCRAAFVPPKAEEAIISSIYPYFKALMCPGHLISGMFLPCKFVMDYIKPKIEHDEQLVTKVIETQLLVVDNKWIVGLNVYFNHRGRGHLSAGWRKFVHENGLEVGDECLFELINNDPVTMKVSIFKHNSQQ